MGCELVFNPLCPPPVLKGVNIGYRGRSYLKIWMAKLLSRTSLHIEQLLNLPLTMPCTSRTVHAMREIQKLFNVACGSCFFLISRKFLHHNVDRWKWGVAHWTAFESPAIHARHGVCVHGARKIQKVSNVGRGCKMQNKSASVLAVKVYEVYKTHFILFGRFAMILTTKKDARTCVVFS